MTPRPTISVFAVRKELNSPWQFFANTLKPLAAVSVVRFLLIIGMVTGFNCAHGEEKWEMVVIKDKLWQAMLQYSQVEAKVLKEQPGQSADDIQQRTYELLASQLEINPKSLQEELPKYAEELIHSSGAADYDLANAAFVAQDYPEVERVALAAADEAQKALPPNSTNAVELLDLAGTSAVLMVKYAEALQNFRKASQFSDRSRDPMEWALQQWNIAYVLYIQGQYAEAEKVYKEVLKEYQLARGAEDADVLAIRSNLASSLYGEGEYAKAETEDREVLKLREKALGPENSNTFDSHNNLAIVLDREGKYAEAEAEDREVIKLEEKVLGAEHPHTLGSRNNLAAVLDNEGKHTEAEAEDRSLVKIKTKVFGPEHPSTLNSRNNLAAALSDEGHFSEAVAEDQEVVHLREKVLGTEHPDTLASRNNLANALIGAGRFVEAEAEAREVLKLREKVLGPDHPATFTACFNLARCLALQKKIDEARPFALRAAAGAEKVFGPNHPYTIKMEMLLQKLQTTD